jgi:hypothetical protein
MTRISIRSTRGYPRRSSRWRVTVRGRFWSSFLSKARPSAKCVSVRKAFPFLSQDQNGFDLPGVTLPQDQDEVRAADGTTCSSAISGSGAYLDVGVIKSNRVLDSGEFATYGRVVIPLGRTPKRLDCARLYELEVERLQMELSLLKMGVLPDGVEITGSTTRTAAANPKPKRNWVRKAGPPTATATDEG